MYGHVVIVIAIAHRFDLWPFGLVGVMGPLRCHACRAVMPYTNHSIHCPLKSHKALETPLQLYGHVVIARQPFKLPIGLIFDHLAMGIY